MTDPPPFEKAEKRAGLPPEPDDDQALDVWRSSDGFTTAVHGAFGGFAGCLLFVLMAATMVDVIGRYVFNAPLPGGNEVIQILMAGIIYAALPSVCRQEAHITVDLLDAVTPGNVITPRQVIVNLTGAVVLGVICYCLWLLADDLSGSKETWEYLGWPRAPTVYFMSILSGVGAAVFFANLLRYLRGAREPKPGFI